MKSKAVLLMILVLSLFETGNRVSAAGEVERIKFNVTVLSEGSSREVLSETTIDGPAGTDFNINLNTSGFDMKSRFLTDLVKNDELLVRVNLETRRHFGVSPNGLPLYEEDKQKESLRMGFSESVVLLPYGKNGGSSTLKIEITPERYSVSADEKESGQLKIDFPKKLSNGEIAIEAKKVPHNYQIEAVLLADGKAVAKGSAESLLEEFKEISLQTSDSVHEAIRGKQFAARIAVDGFIRNLPFDLVSITFDLSEGSGKKVTNGKGIHGLGREFRYGLEDELGEGFELVFRVTEKKQ